MVPQTDGALNYANVKLSDITAVGEAVIILQKNNHVVVVDKDGVDNASGRTSSFPTGQSRPAADLTALIKGVGRSPLDALSAPP